MVNNSPPKETKHTATGTEETRTSTRTSTDRRTDMWTLHRVKNTVQAGEPDLTSADSGCQQRTPTPHPNTHTHTAAPAISKGVHRLQCGSLSWPGPAWDPRQRRYSRGCTAGSLGAGAPRRPWWTQWEPLPSGWLPDETVKELMWPVLWAGYGRVWQRCGASLPGRAAWWWASVGR